MTDEEQIDNLLSKHLNEIKAGHDDKLKQSLLEMIREARIDELEWAEHNADDINFSIQERIEKLRSGA